VIESQESEKHHDHKFGYKGHCIVCGRTDGLSFSVIVEETTKT